MKRYFVILTAMLLVAAIAAPSFAGVEFKYGGLYRARMQANDNLTDGTDDFDDQSFWIDQRLRMFFSFIASERLQLVTKWEADTLWGNETTGAGRHGGGDVGADATNLEMKNVYIDFLIPQTPLRASVGVQGIAAMKGWLIDDDFSAAVVSTKFDPFAFRLGYIAARNEDVTTTDENIDDIIMGVDYAAGPFAASLYGLWQNGHDTPISTQFLVSPNTTVFGDAGSPWRLVSPTTAVRNTAGFDALNATGLVDDNQLFDIGLSLGYKMDWFNVFVNYVQNLGSYDTNFAFAGAPAESYDYRGFMVEAGANFTFNPFTFTVGGFYTSGDDDYTDDTEDAFRYPRGASHYWSEIMGQGTLDSNVGDAGDRDHIGPANRGDYNAADGPSNLWTISAGAAWQALPTTKLTLNYYYIKTAEDVISDLATLDTDDTIGHEVDFYLDQQVVDGLTLRLVGAYLFADDALSVNDDDDDIWETGAQLMWAF
jgi:hypothetical protein